MIGTASEIGGFGALAIPISFQKKLTERQQLQVEWHLRPARKQRAARTGGAAN
jgi:hypothetical protein